MRALVVALLFAASPHFVHGVTVAVTIMGGVYGVPGVEVRVDGPGYRQTALTDVSGALRFTMPQPGSYELDSELSGFSSEHHVICLKDESIEYVIQFQPLPSSCCRMWTSDPSCPPAPPPDMSWSGHVMDERGRAISGANVFTAWDGESRFARTDAKGAFELTAREAIRVLRFEITAPGYATRVVTVSCNEPVFATLFHEAECS